MSFGDFFRLGAVFIALLWSVVVSGSALDKQLERLSSAPKSALVAEGTSYRAAVQLREHDLLVPASTLKILTAYLAIQRWGLEHRFTTEFYLHNGTLWVKGLGDPFLTSEEVGAIGEQLRDLVDVQAFNGISVDHSLFPELKLSGKGRSDNPYDAGNAALALNFNSLYLQRSKDSIVSAEPQTPITPLAKNIGLQRLSVSEKKKKRVALPGGRDMSARYFAEVLSYKLVQQQLPVELGRLPKDAKLVYRHQNSQKLADVLRAMLKYSNNFIANQLYLLLGRQSGDEVVSSIESRRYFEKQVMELFGWQGMAIYDGAGLSRKNRLSAAHLTELLSVFKPWMGLLPSHTDEVRAKTGTLIGVRTYAGYYLDRDDQWRSFALLMNKPVQWRFRYKLAEALTK